MCLYQINAIIFLLNIKDKVFDLIINAVCRSHENVLIVVFCVAVGMIAGIAMAISDWRSKLGFTTILSAGYTAITQWSKDDFKNIKNVISETGAISPLFVALNSALLTLFLVLFAAFVAVFTINLWNGKRNGDPHFFVTALKRGFSVVAAGLWSYHGDSPDIKSRREIDKLERRVLIMDNTISIIEVFIRNLANETISNKKSRQHFVDVMEAQCSFLLTHMCGEGPGFEKFRLAIFEKSGNLLEYLVTTHKNVWTGHSKVGFAIDKCFMGKALEYDRPLIYPKEKKRKFPFEKRENARYNSFIVVPIPCGYGRDAHVGVLTLDYVGDDKIFDETKRNILIAFSQVIYAFYILNNLGVKGNEKVQTANV